MASATRIAFAGIGLIRARPRAVLAWGFVYLLFGIVVSLLTRATVERMLLTFPVPGGRETIAQVDWTGVGPVLVANLGMIGMMIVLLAAAMRAMLRPEEQGAYFIRVRMDELRLLGTIVLLWLIMLLIYLGSVLAMALLAALLAFAAVAGGATAQAGVVLLVIFLLVAEFALLLAAQTRLAIALPLTLLRGRIVVREAWRRSKGHFWPLFGGFLLNALVLLGVMLICAVPMLLAYSGDGGLAGIADPRWQVAMMHSPLMYPLWLLMPLFGGFLVAMVGGALGMAVIETDPPAGG